MYDWVPIETILPGAEDCLYLNIYVPLHALESNKSLPVYLYFHGGAFLAGENNLIEGAYISTTQG